MTTYTAELDVRFRDLDPMQHVNNAIYPTYLEQARALFYEEVVGVGLGDIDTVLVSQEIEYERPIEGIGSVLVELTVGELGRSSIPMEYEVRSEGRRRATGRTVQVYVDPDTGESTAIPEHHRRRLRGG
jgi:acyl-CoA thioester hydrolase